MDKERAKFILQSYRPDGGDADEPVFAEALGLVARDRELGEWLAEERAQDAAFAAILAKVEIPEDLREAVFEVLEGAQEHPAEFDADFVGALAAVRPPAGLRAEILAARAVGPRGPLTGEESSRSRRGIFRAVWWASAVAAVIVVSFAVAAFFAEAGGNDLAGNTPGEVESSAVAMLRSPFFSLDLQNDRQAALFEWLQERQLPTPAELPKGLQGVRCIGCKFVEVGDRKTPGSLICYRKDGSMVHLVTIDRKAVDAGSLAELDGAVRGCHDCPKNIGWSMTRWADEKHAYFLLAQMESERLASLF